MNKFLFLGSIVSLSLCLFSCREERLSSEIPAENPVVNPVMSKDTEMKTQFAKALAKALKDHKELRDFIKMEALKQVNRDYDVLYHVIKNKPVVALTAMGGNTIHDLLLPYFETEAQLLEIESSMPLLTIFVPDLPEDSFSAESWETMDEIPYVGVRTYGNDDVPIYMADGGHFVLEAKYIPGFPVVVIKDNERVISNTDSRYNKLDTRVLTEPTDDVQLRLADNNFDVTIVNPPPPPPPSGDYPRVDSYHVQAYDAYKDYTPGGWQRDFIYYGLTPDYPNGALRQNYIEYVTAIQFIGNPNTAYTNLAEGLNDPRFKDETIIWGPQDPPQTSGWTDGEYDFRIICHTGSTDVSQIIDKGVPIVPEDLFVITYTKEKFLWGLYKYTPHITGTKMYDLYERPERIELVTWDLSTKSNIWKIEFWEVDTGADLTKTESHTFKYNGNVSIDINGGGEKTKWGLKFGSSVETTDTQTYTIEWEDGDDHLGDSEIRFDHNVVDWKPLWLFPEYGRLVPRKYNPAPNIEIEVRPRLAY
ncbi:MAG: hypothetical protein LBE36_07265 [Flavobacteriaceae bacterium]|jgi:hypothetical protein|nr:hypothetical protein [Flavobacteriaceae bacterium]